MFGVTSFILENPRRCRETRFYDKISFIASLPNKAIDKQ